MTLTDAQQTEKLDRLRERLQSIAILAVMAQDKIGNPDAVSDLLADVEADLAVANKLTTDIALDRL